MKLFQEDVLVSVDEVVALCSGISHKTIYESIRRYNTGRSKSWANIPDNEDLRKRLIIYSSIPATTKIKFNAPSVDDLIKRVDILDKESKYIQIESAKKQLYIEIEYCLTSAIDKGYIKFMPKYSALKQESRERVVKLACEHAFKAACVELNARRSKIKLKDIFAVQKDMPYNWVYKSYDKFVEAHKKWRTQGINNIHGGFGKPKPHLTKVTDYVKALIEKYYKHPNQYTIDQITDLVNSEIEKKKLKTIDRSSVSRYVNKPENKNRLMMYRNSEYFDSKVMPIVRRKDIKMAGDLYYADGTPLQIPCWNESMTKEIRLNLFAVIDVKTKKIVGFDLAESEDRYNVLSAIKMAFDLERIVPFELKYDNASATKTEEFKALKDMLELKGCRFTPTQKGNPKEKSQVERLFGSFQSKYQRMIDGFMGEGIRSSRPNGRINADFVNRLRSKNNLYTYESMVVIVTNLIHIYNQTKTHLATSPSEQFEKCEKLRANKIDPSDIAMLFWKHKTIKASRGEVSTTIRHTTYHYTIWDNELKLRLSGQSVKMYYDECDLSTVHLFSEKGEYLCECRQATMVHEGQAGQTADDVKTLIKVSKHAESIKTTVKKQTAKIRAVGMEEDGDDFLNMLSPYSVQKEKYNNAEGNMLIEYVLDKKNINRDMIREYNPVNTEREDHEKNVKTSRNKRSPFSAKNHQISVLEIDDIL
ncbi:Mu transposase C-terminal domain-containing protein [Sphingobacterium siyangense]|uniref:Mu transposase-like protein n=1 Tax=Sphingobacterium siyangense TaxID=459529 RepID=A0A562M8P4_9SPHI|nr:Mu transposase C-terminal domain-containing protein [Sphingobacterium siyangense]TWI16309.1 Mu transposase-like protein [Sphingobacterium siyangense]